MKEYQPWEARRKHITSVGGWRQKEGVVYNRGLSMLHDCVGTKSWFQILFLNSTGRMPERRLAEWLEAVFICTSWPDSRIWCNTMGAFGGTSRTSSVTAVASGLLASDSLMYGVGPLKLVAEFIITLKSNLAQGATVDLFFEKYCIKGEKIFIPGFARPLSRGDERIEPMINVSHKLNYKDGPHMISAMKLSDYSYTKTGETINIGGYIVAFLLDQDFTPTEISRLLSLIVNGGIHSCFSEAADDIPNGYLPLHCKDIKYKGPKPRKVTKE